MYFRDSEIKTCYPQKFQYTGRKFGVSGKILKGRKKLNRARKKKKFPENARIKKRRCQKNFKRSQDIFHGQKVKKITKTKTLQKEKNKIKNKPQVSIRKKSEFSTKKS